MTQSLVTFTYVCSSTTVLEERGDSEGSRGCPGSHSKSCLAPRAHRGRGGHTGFGPQEAGSDLSKCPGGEGWSRRRVYSVLTLLLEWVSLPVGPGPHGKAGGLKRGQRSSHFSRERFLCHADTGQPQAQLQGPRSWGRVPCNKCSFSREGEWAPAYVWDQTVPGAEGK